MKLRKFFLFLSLKLRLSGVWVQWSLKLVLLYFGSNADAVFERVVKGATTTIETVLIKTAISRIVIAVLSN